MRTNIDIDESLVRKARKLTRLKTKRQIVDKALELLDDLAFRFETRELSCLAHQTLIDIETKRQIVDKALELLVRSESRKGILRYYGSGIWKGDLKAMRRNRV